MKRLAYPAPSRGRAPNTLCTPPSIVVIGGDESGLGTTWVIVIGQLHVKFKGRIVGSQEEHLIEALVPLEARYVDPRRRKAH